MQKIVKTKGSASSDVYVDETKVEIKSGAFYVCAIVYEKTDKQTYKVDLTIIGLENFKCNIK